MALYKYEDGSVVDSATGVRSWPLGGTEAEQEAVRAWVATLPPVSELGKAALKTADHQDHYNAIRDVMCHLGLSFSKNDDYPDDARDIIAAIDALRAKAPASLVERARRQASSYSDDYLSAFDRGSTMGIVRDLAALSGDAVAKVEECPVDRNTLARLLGGQIRFDDADAISRLASWALRVGGGK